MMYGLRALAPIGILAAGISLGGATAVAQTCSPGLPDVAPPGCTLEARPWIDAPKAPPVDPVRIPGRPWIDDA